LFDQALKAPKAPRQFVGLRIDRQRHAHTLVHAPAFVQ
jgi:hypothetical protein